MSYVDLSLGEDAQEEFAKVLFRCRRATEDEDKYEHWDLKGGLQDLGTKRLTFDVKDNVDRERKAFPVELQGITGEPGWLYGKADCIAYNHPESFTVIWREELVALVERLMEEHCVDLNWYTDDEADWTVLGQGKPGQMVYRRLKWGRDDRVVLVDADELFAVANAIVLKGSKSDSKGLGA